MWQTILMCIAVFMVILGLVSFIIRLAKVIIEKNTTIFLGEVILLTIGISYLIWYCN